MNAYRTFAVSLLFIALWVDDFRALAILLTVVIVIMLSEVVEELRRVGE